MTTELSLKDRLLLAAVRVSPRRALTRAVGEAAGWTRPGPLARLAVRGFARRYDLDLAEAELPIEGYPSVRALFTRGLRAGARTIAPGERVAVAPADGRIYEAGETREGRLVQAKGMSYTLAALLADGSLAGSLSGGAYVAIYLSPHDYHRVHFPLAGEVRALSHVAGDLWPVNPASVATVPELFARNERLVVTLDGPIGRCAVVMVGATVVGRLRATFDGERPAAIGRRLFDPAARVEKGQELGVFDMGSTVIVCFAPGALRLAPTVRAGAPIRVGERLGEPG
ncbi:MAG: archaetidylserine decarboxylase [Deltaproteobacteria bacterium]